MPNASHKPSATRRRTAKEERWSKILNEWKQSGQSAAAFCRQRHLSESMFWFWKRELPIRRRKSARPRPRPVRLVPVRVVSQSSANPMPIELVLPDGKAVRLVAGFDQVALQELLSALGRQA